MKFIQLEGSPYEAGYYHGKTIAEDIVSFRGFLYERFRLMGKSRNEVLSIAMQFEPIIKKYFQAQLEEIRGLADGSGILHEEALFLNCYRDITALFEQECTAGAVNGSLLMHNLDLPFPYQKFLLIERRRLEGTFACVGRSFIGSTAVMGVNEKGLSLLALGVHSYDVEIGLPHRMPAVLLETCSTVDEFLQKFKFLPLCAPQNLLVADKNHCIVIEYTSNHLAVRKCRNKVIACANHFVSPQMRGYYRIISKERHLSNVTRYKRVQSLVNSHKDDINLNSAIDIMRDHENSPSQKSICRHGEISSISSIIILLPNPEIWVTDGNPCQNDYSKYSL